MASFILFGSQPVVAEEVVAAEGVAGCSAAFLGDSSTEMRLALDAERVVSRPSPRRDYTNEVPALSPKSGQAPVTIDSKMP